MYYAALKSQDIARAPLYAARTIQGAKRLGTRIFGNGFAHHKIIILDEQPDIVAWRGMDDAKWVTGLDGTTYYTR